MKIVKISLAICILVAIFISILLWFMQPRFITQKEDDLKNIVIIFNPDYPGLERIVHINDYLEIKQVYKILKETTKINVNKHPRHAESIQWNSKFNVCFEYNNGEKDEFFATEKYGGILRFLNTKGSSGDSGYIIGINEKLWEYISHLE